MSWGILGGIVGSVLDYAGNRDNASRAPRLAGRTAYQENYQGLAGRLEAAKAHGIHPTVALGGNISSSGAPGMVGSDFRGAFTDMANEYQRKREWAQEHDMRKAQEAEQNRRNKSEQTLNDAQIQHIQKQNEFIDEQIRASQEQRLRDAARLTKSTASGAHDMRTGLSVRSGNGYSDNVSGDVVYEPNRVVRSRSGLAGGVNPGYEKVTLGDRVVKVPFGTTANHEPSELFQTYRDLEAALAPDGIIGSRWQDAKDRVQRWKKKRPILPSDYSNSPQRRYRRK